MIAVKFKHGISARCYEIYYFQIRSTINNPRIILKKDMNSSAQVIDCRDIDRMTCNTGDNNLVAQTIKFKGSPKLDFLLNELDRIHLRGS